MEATILKLLDINKQFVEDSKSPKLSDKIVAHYYNLSEPTKQLHFKDALIQQLFSFSNLNDFTNFSHLLYAALAIKPPNLDGVLYKFLINHKQLNQTFEGHNPNQLCLKILSQIPVNPIYVNNINQFFKNKLDESIGLHLFHFYAVNHLHDESLSVLNTICDSHFYMENGAVLSFQLFTSLKYLEPEVFEVWFQNKLEVDEIPAYVLKILEKTFKRMQNSYPENWKKYLIKFIQIVGINLNQKNRKTIEPLPNKAKETKSHINSNQIEIITSLILTAEIEVALEHLISVLIGTETYYDVSKMKTQYNDVVKQMRQGVINVEEAAKKQNNIVNSILQLLKKIPIDELSQSRNNDEKDKRSKRKRLALVIGCSDYERANILKNPINDARNMQKQLKALGFDVYLCENPNHIDFKIAIDDFGLELKNYDEGLFYFSGHGFQLGGNNYLIPINANLISEKQIEYECIRADRILKHMENSNNDVNFMILDSNSENQSEHLWNKSLLSKGLAKMEARQSTFIAIPSETAYEQTEYNNEEGNSIFTKELVKQIDNREKTINEMLREVKESVLKFSSKSDGN